MTATPEQIEEGRKKNKWGPKCEGGRACPRCGSKKITALLKNDRFQCDECECTFSATGEILYHEYWKPSQPAADSTDEGGR